jgi:hypothetical protein
MTWHIADLPEGEMGRMYFRSGKAEIEKYTNYPFGRYYHEEKVEPRDNAHQSRLLFYKWIWKSL